MNASNILKRNDNIVFRKIEGEYVLLPMAASSENVEYIYNLNEIGGSIWEKIDGRKTLQDIINELVAEYDESQDIIQQQVAEFINDLKEAKLIEAA